ncbi:EAL domain-containing protein [Lichenihabitans psoromatis]|uniref:EAL domain-containing protein n=1 Tax=Lichenihabitans psoromatis TaxID=2528642 RepID=UPI0010362428|nr:EAL domain-containing protein [Lichenihabitans psoromatis]
MMGHSGLPSPSQASARPCSSEVEALVRWQHPTRGLVPPTDFITIAEETGLIVPLGQWVMEEACRQVDFWQAEFGGAEPLIVSINLSPHQFQQPNLIEEVKRALHMSGLSAACLKLEITEGVIMRDVAATLVTLNQLKELDIQLAIDDFGTGYSSLAYLKRLPLDVLKIDRSFIGGSVGTMRIRLSCERSSPWPRPCICRSPPKVLKQRSRKRSCETGPAIVPKATSIRDRSMQKRLQPPLWQLEIRAYS